LTNKPSNSAKIGNQSKTKREAYMYTLHILIGQRLFRINIIERQIIIQRVECITDVYTSQCLTLADDWPVDDYP